MKVTQQQIENWLGTSEPFGEAIEVLTDLVNGNYDIETFKSDVLSLEDEE